MALAAGIGPVVVVTAGQLATALHPSVVHVVNDDWADGQITSLRAGIEAASGFGASAVVVGLGDQPFVSVEAWRAVAATDAPIAVATYDGRRGHPVRLARETWPLLPEHRRRGSPRADRATTRSRHCSTVRWFPDRHRHRGGSAAMAEQLVNEFTVNRPIDEAWAVITDVERIAPCLPGAQLQEIEGDDLPRHRQDQARFDHAAVQRPGDVHRARRRRPPSRTQGRGTRHRRAGQRLGGDRGQRREPLADQHAVSSSPPTCTSPGKVAQFGRGIIGDVSKKLMAQFAGNLNTMLDEQPAETPPESNGDTAADQRARRAGRGGARSAPAESALGADTPRPEPTSPRRRGCARSTARPAEPVDLAGVAGPAVLKRRRAGRDRSAAAAVHRAPPALTRRR